MIFPKGSTGYIQPQDLSLFRSWRFIHEKIEHYVHINRTEMNLNDRQYFINMHSIIHNQLSAPQFKNLIKSGFVQANILNETIGEINKPKDVCFKFYDLYCSVIRCKERTLLTCAWCEKPLCYYHLIENLHLHLEHILWNIIFYTLLLSYWIKSKISVNDAFLYIIVGILTLRYYCTSEGVLSREA